MITENTFERFSIPITDISEEFILQVLVLLSGAGQTLAGGGEVVTDEEIRRLEGMYENYINTASEWMDEELAHAYLRGIKNANGSSGGRVAAGVYGSMILADSVDSRVSDKARKILKDYPAHHSAYGVFRSSADNALSETRLPIIRQTQDRIRELTILASDRAYRESDTITRLSLTQDLIREYADDGINGVVYRNGRRVHLDSYSEMVARTQTKNAFNQATLNRLQEYDIDLVEISVHYPCSDLCEPHQGKVFSQSGGNGRYPSLDGAIADGLFHANCKHSLSGYTPGDKTTETTINTKENEQMYDAQMKQRYNERQIKKWKRREATSLTPEERLKSKSKIREWQERQRNYVSENEFLRRAYKREQV